MWDYFLCKGHKVQLSFFWTMHIAKSVCRCVVKSFIFVVEYMFQMHCKSFFSWQFVMDGSHFTFKQTKVPIKDRKLVFGKRMCSSIILLQVSYTRKANDKVEVWIQFAACKQSVKHFPSIAFFWGATNAVVYLISRVIVMQVRQSFDSCGKGNLAGLCFSFWSWQPCAALL